MHEAASCFVLTNPHTTRSPHTQDTTVLVCYPPQISSGFSTMSSASGPSPGQTAASSSNLASNFKSMLDIALAEYKKKTGNDLLALWLASELQTCESVDSVLDVLRGQAKAFERSDADQKLIKWIDPLVNVLFTFSGALGDGLSLVRIRFTNT